MEAKNEALRITGGMCMKKPFYAPLAQTLLEEIRAYFEEPENEREFQAWLKTQEKPAS